MGELPEGSSSFSFCLDLSLGITSMLTLQCTQKLLKELNTELSPIKDTDPIALWHANLLMLDRRKCVLFTNDATRYSFLVPGLKKPDFKVLGQVFLDNLFRCMRIDDIEQNGIEKVLNACSRACFTKTSSRSVLGTMKEVTGLIECIIQDEGGLQNADMGALNVEVNRMPCGPLGYDRPVKRFRALLA